MNGVNSMSYSLRSTAISVLLVLLGGCATAPVMQDIETLPADTGLVFGSAEIYVDDKKLDLGFSWSGENHFYLLILPPDSSVATTYEVTDEGTFYWPLPPGEYLLLGYRWQQAGTARSGDIRASFTVPEIGTDAYIGSLEFRGTEYALKPNLLDRYDRQKAIHDGRFPERRETTIESLMQPPAPPGKYAAMLPACDERFAIECGERFRGITPTSPEVTTSGFPKVSTLQPEFTWQGSADAGIHYDLVLYEAATYTINQVTDFYARGRLAAYVEDIAATSWRPAKPLKPSTRYFWSVRSRDGDVVSGWSTQSYFAFAIVAWSSGYGQWFQFQTP